MSISKSSHQVDQEMIAKINSQRFSVQELVDITTSIQGLPESRRGFTGRVMVLVKMYPKQIYRALAADNRLTAMSALIAENKLPFGVMPKASDGTYMIGACVFEAAALEPILFKDGTPYFDVNAFKERVLALSVVEGIA